jgi:molybdenum cofactor guanylyltransferase
MDNLPQPDTAGFVLAGGQSSRMGRDKALLAFAGRPLVAHALSILTEAGLPASIAGADPSAHASLSAYAPVIADAQPGLGPLSGVCAALASTSARYAVFLPVDLPFMPPSLLIFLLHHARITGRAVTVPAVSGFNETFPAVLDRVVLPALQAELAAGRGGCFQALQAAASSLCQSISRISVDLVVQSGLVAHPHALPPHQWFLNVNTRADMDRAEAISRRRIA